MRFIDLTHPIHHGMFKFWGDYHPNVEVEITGTYERDKCQVRKLTIGTHTGTHIDAPRHFFPAGVSIDQVPVSRFVVDAHVVDLTGKMSGGTISTDDLPDLKFLPGNALILKIGWDAHWGTDDFYKDFPVLDPDTGKALIGLGVSALAVDIPLMPDIHEIFLSSGALLIENLCNLTLIAKPQVTLIAMPLKVQDGDGAPARVIALEDFPHGELCGDARRSDVRLPRVLRVPGRAKE